MMLLPSNHWLTRLTIRTLKATSVVLARPVKVMMAAVKGDSAAGSARAAGPGPGLGGAAAAGVTASDRNTRDKRRHKRSRKDRDRRRRSVCESQSENELQPEILALFDNNNPYANADSISRSTSVLKTLPKAGVVQTARPKRAYVCGLLSELPQCSLLPT